MTVILNTGLWDCCMVSVTANRCFLILGKSQDYAGCKRNTFHILNSFHWDARDLREVAVIAPHSWCLTLMISYDHGFDWQTRSMFMGWIYKRWHNRKSPNLNIFWSLSTLRFFKWLSFNDEPVILKFWTPSSIRKSIILL